MKSSSGRPSSRPPRRALATPRVAARPPPLATPTPSATLKRRPELLVAVIEIASGDADSRFGRARCVEPVAEHPPQGGCSFVQSSVKCIHGPCAEVERLGGLEGTKVGGFVHLTEAPCRCIHTGQERERQREGKRHDKQRISLDGGTTKGEQPTPHKTPKHKRITRQCTQAVSCGRVRYTKGT